MADTLEDTLPIHDHHPDHAPKPAPARAGIDVLDASLRVVLRGTSPADVVPVEGALLEPALLAEVAHVVPAYDFDRYPVATGFVGDDRVWRAVRFGAPQTYYLVLVEPSTLPAAVSRFATAQKLDSAQTDLLRLIAGGYSLVETARRLDRPVATVAGDRVRLLQHLKVERASDLVRMIAGSEEPAGLESLERALSAVLGSLTPRLSS